ncbi:universal stress protein [Micromonospora sp. NBC_00389]|uniref:universal stress protein n=1 Tax=Micromonospora sp. NBC_00389 TaxID=2903586 RepID=UPI002E1E363B
MTTRSGAFVVVGVDGSASALDAVRAGARAAAAQHLPLRVVHAFVWPLYATVQGPLPTDVGLRREADELVAEAVAEAKKVSADLPVTGAVVDGTPTPVLLRATRDAALLVLGHRGLGGFTELLVGSTAVQVSARADCPVLVVRGESRADGPVVVGVDGSALSTEALGFAFAEAARRDTTLVAVHAWQIPTSFIAGEVLPLVYDLDAATAAEERILAEAVAGWSERYPEVPVRQRVVYGAPARVLIEESVAAQLTVVGAHGRGALGGMLLGSVSHTVLHHAKGPLAIVRHQAGSRED